MSASNQKMQFASIPELSLPKGGGAIKGIGEKFSANAVTGTGSMTVPIVVSPGRNGVQPELSLQYNSGAGNGPFGMGWQLSLPAISRKTEKQLPTYDEALDTYLLSGAEDLVLQPGATGTVVNTHTVTTYRPRIEGLFARVERWVNQSDVSDVHWRVFSKENVLTIYGKDASSRLMDPHQPERIFSWLISEVRDDKGNLMVYHYQTENSKGVPNTVSESHRNATDRTANRYLKSIFYGNKQSGLEDSGNRPIFVSDDLLKRENFLFEVVFDYGDHSTNQPTAKPNQDWICREDAFSSYRAGFEIRTYRLCRRVLMFHHFKNEKDVGLNCLVNATQLQYSTHHYALLTSTKFNRYKRTKTAYLEDGLPPVEFHYTRANIQTTVETLSGSSLENLPVGVDGKAYQFLDLHGEGIPGVLIRQEGNFYYKRNTTPIRDRVTFEGLESIASMPNISTNTTNVQFSDVDGDGQVDLVVNDDALQGFYQHDKKTGWHPFKSFKKRLNKRMNQYAKFLDLTGDGRPDILLTEDEVLVWHASEAEAGYNPEQHFTTFLDQKNEPKLVLSLKEESIFLADFSGDGLTDIVRIRCNDICYWPNLGYGRFGKKITMANVSPLDQPDQFDYKQIRLADIDGSGTTDVIYLHRSGVKILVNASGDHFRDLVRLPVSPAVNDRVATHVFDLLGNGTACLVWSSPLPGDRGRQLQYVNLMGAHKPYLLTEVHNNLGAETKVRYAPSTKFYLQDQLDGNPWVTKLPFPVHVVTQVETIDRISKNRFITQYKYHHGYYDAHEREFRGFAMVEQLDSDSIAALKSSNKTFQPDNESMITHVPPVLTKRWYHTGAYFDQEALSAYFSTKEYYQDKHHLAKMPMPKSQAAARAYKGLLLREELYSVDGSAKAKIPYFVNEQTYQQRCLQQATEDRPAVFFTYPSESLKIYYDRNPSDPRILHDITLTVDDVGNVLELAKIVYGRQKADAKLPSAVDRNVQLQDHLLLIENDFTQTLNDKHTYRLPMMAQSKTYELTGLTKSKAFYRKTDLLDTSFSTRAYHVNPTPNITQKRLVEHECVLYQKDDLTGLLPLKTIESKALIGETYRLAFTQDLIDEVFKRNQTALITHDMMIEAGYIKPSFSASSTDYWMPSGKTFYHSAATQASQAVTFAKKHFFQMCRVQSPFHTTALPQTSEARYDDYALLLLETEDALGNKVTSGERSPNGKVTSIALDYRLLKPTLVMDENRNRIKFAFDTNGFVVATAIMGKPEEALGDDLSNVNADLSGADKQFQLDNPNSSAQTALGNASTRLIYDVFAYYRTRNNAQVKPNRVYTISRETHVSALAAGDSSELRREFVYSDGFGREIQSKIQAENNQWVASAWKIFNNKGKPVLEFEPFFTSSHDFEFGVTVGVSPIVFYDPLDRVVAILHPNQTYEKVVFDAWQQTTWDVNDTVLGDPRVDPDIQAITKPYFDFAGASWQAWYQKRIDEGLGDAEKMAAIKTENHANTPTTVYLDALARPYLTRLHNGFDEHGEPDLSYHRVALDIEDNELTVRDAIQQNNDKLGRIAMQSQYNLLGDLIYQCNQESGKRWILNTITGDVCYRFDELGQTFRMTYDALRRPDTVYLKSKQSNTFQVFEKTLYGEQHADALNHNLRNKMYATIDQSGITKNELYDFKGNVIISSKQFAKTVGSHIAWPQGISITNYQNALSSLLLAERYESRTSYNALNKPIMIMTPHTSSMSANHIRLFYNEGNLLEQVDVNSQSATYGRDLHWVPFIVNIDYDAKGQRQKIEYGNGSETIYGYDPLTYRLIHLLTKRNTDNLQDYYYTYDPVGNITHIQDDAQQQHFFSNHKIDPSNSYTYDPLYRLIHATGREHLGQNRVPLPHDANDALRSQLLSPGDGNAMGSYEEFYIYDAVGNLLGMQHRGKSPRNPGWTRYYTYQEASKTEPNKYSNRLTQSMIGTHLERYQHDAHGNITHLPHLSNNPNNCTWDAKDQLQSLDLGGGGRVQYSYDQSGNRARKRWQKTQSTVEETFYFNGFEIHQKHINNRVILEKETLHIMDDQERVALLETRTTNLRNEPGADQLVRYQYNNHLGSSTLECDHRAQIISYEEYSPFGNTVYQAVRNQTETKKRYRFTGKERDSESGLYYHGARYYLPHLGRWLSCDPAGFVDGPNLYVYVKNNPIKYLDPDGKAVAEATLGFIAADLATPDPTDVAGPASVVKFGIYALVGGVAYLFVDSSRQKQASSKPNSTTSTSTNSAPKTNPSPGPSKTGPTIGPAPKNPRRRKPGDPYNLDSSLFIAYASDKTTPEQRKKIVRELLNVSDNKSHIMTETARHELNMALNYANAREKSRVEELKILINLRYVPDDPSDDIMNIDPSSTKGNIGQSALGNKPVRVGNQWQMSGINGNGFRDRIIFGTGHKHGLATYTADQAFSTAAKKYVPSLETKITKPGQSFVGYPTP